MSDNRGISGRNVARQDCGQGALPILFHYNSSTSAGTTNTDSMFPGGTPFSFRIVRAWFCCTEAPAADSEDVKLTDGTNDITDTADYSALADNDNMEFSNYDNAYSTISKGGSLNIVKTATTAVTSFDMYVMVVRV